MKEIVYFKNTKTIKKVISGKYQLKFVYFKKPKEIFPKEIFCTLLINDSAIFEFSIVGGDIIFHIDNNQLTEEISDMVVLFKDCYIKSEGKIDINSYIELIP